MYLGNQDGEDIMALKMQDLLFKEKQLTKIICTVGMAFISKRMSA